MKPLSDTAWIDGPAGEALIAEFGQKNVEETLIYLTTACDSRGLSVIIEKTPERVREILEAVHGRLPVNGARINLDGGFMHKPTTLRVK